MVKPGAHWKGWESSGRTVLLLERLGLIDSSELRWGRLRAGRPLRGARERVK